MNNFPKLVAVFALALLVLSILVGQSPAQNLYIVRTDPGGRISDYLTKLNTFTADGTKIVIDGECSSACTLYIIQSEAQVCFTTNAVLGFHKPFARRTVDGQQSLVTDPSVIEEAGRIWETMVSLHREEVQEWLRRVYVPDVYSGDNQNDLVIIPHSVLERAVERC